MEGLPLRTTIISADAAQDEAKRAFVRTLGADHVCAVGNGRNDAGMVAEAALGIALIQGEGAWPGTVAAADVVCTGIGPALEILLHPTRLVATLRR